METIRGFSKNTQSFLKELSENNNKDWFQANKSRYEAAVFEPAVMFVTNLGNRLKAAYPDLRFGTQRNGSGSIMRIYRDIRFSPDKRPYKEHLGIIFWIGDGKKVELPCFYFHIDKDEGFFYGGQHIFPKEVLEQYRAAVDDSKTGAALEKILRSLETERLPLMEDPEYKRVPRGFESDHPRGNLLRMKGLGTGRTISWKEAVSEQLSDICFAAAEKMKPLMEWIVPLNGR